MTQESGEKKATEGREEMPERWSAQRKAEIVLRLLRGDDLVQASAVKVDASGPFFPARGFLGFDSVVSHGPKGRRTWMTLRSGPRWLKRGIGRPRTAKPATGLSIRAGEITSRCSEGPGSITTLEACA